MLTCTFFGHRDCPSTIKSNLKSTIKELIENQCVNNFLIGDSGQFDEYCRSVLKDIKKDYININYTVVLSKIPSNNSKYDDYSDTILPAGIEIGHPRFAIDRRNKWLIANADYVICYVKHGFGGAYKFMKLAERRKKTVINLYHSSIE